MDKENRKALICWNKIKGPIIEFFQKLHTPSPYREPFLDLFAEARRAFVAGCPIASIIVSGETLFRAECHTILQLVATGHEISHPDKTALTISPNTDYARAMNKIESLRLVDSESMLKETGLLTDLDILRLSGIRYLRNDAVHGHLPTVLPWDDPDGRVTDEGELRELLFSTSFEFPEAYKYFVGQSRNKQSMQFDCRNYGGISLKSLGPEEQLAAMQILFLVDAIENLGNLIS